MSSNLGLGCQNSAEVSENWHATASMGPHKLEAGALSERNVVQWSSPDGINFGPVSKTTTTLPTGVYEIDASPEIGVFFKRIPVKTEGLIRFPETNIDRVLNEIQCFWSKETKFKEYGLAFKRGIILFGPAGGGKSSALQLIMEDVIKRSGIVIVFTSPELFVQGYRLFRQIQPETPVVVTMEDLDAILDRYNESFVLQILDGVHQVHKTVFLATTNYPENLGARIINRPSRFDKRIEIGYPNEESRSIYIKHIAKKELSRIDLVKWVKDTKDFTFAHIKELFVACFILGDDYDEAVETLREMCEKVKIKENMGRGIGFEGSNKKALR